MGDLMRRYWHPVAAKAQLLERKVMPVRVFGEDLILFIDEQGRTGLVGDRCPHRLVKLDCAFTTEKGLKCPYHGWTYDTTGQCVDQPGEPATSRYKEKVKILSYPLEELAGLIFAYLGPLPAPLLPRWDRLVWDNVYRVIGFVKIPCNWLQCMENTPDPVHGVFLHGHYFKHWLKENGIEEAAAAQARGRLLHAGHQARLFDRQIRPGPPLAAGRPGSGQGHLVGIVAAGVPGHPLHLGQRPPHLRLADADRRHQHDGSLRSRLRSGAGCRGAQAGSGPLL